MYCRSLYTRHTYTNSKPTGVNYNNHQGCLPYGLQIFQFLNYDILTFREREQIYRWQHKPVEHKLTNDRVTRFIDAIVIEWVSPTDITDSQTTLVMSLEDVVRMVRNLVTGAGVGCGINEVTCNT